MNILLVDDDSFILNLISEALKLRGHVVLTGNDGKDLLQMIEYTEFDLVITDNDMPLICGVDALRTLRNNERFRHLPVIVHTGNTSQELRKNIEALNGILVTKELTANNLITTVDSIKI